MKPNYLLQILLCLCMLSCNHKETVDISIPTNYYRILDGDSLKVVQENQLDSLRIEDNELLLLLIGHSFSSNFNRSLDSLKNWKLHQDHSIQETIVFSDYPSSWKRQLYPYIKKTSFPFPMYVIQQTPVKIGDIENTTNSSFYFKTKKHGFIHTGLLTKDSAISIIHYLLDN